MAVRSVTDGISQQRPILLDQGRDELCRLLEHSNEIAEKKKMGKKQCRKSVVVDNTREEPNNGNVGSDFI